MHDGWCGKLIQHVTSLKLAATSGYHVSDPLAISSIGERDQECVGRSRNLHWRPVNPTCLSTHVRNNTEAGQSGGESAHDPIRNSAIEGCYPLFAKPDDEDSSQQDCQKQQSESHSPLH